MGVTIETGWVGCCLCGGTLAETKTVGKMSRNIKNLFNEACIQSTVKPASQPPKLLKFGLVVTLATVRYYQGSKQQLSHDMTKPTKRVCAQRRLRSAWATAQSDQSLRCAFNG